MHRFHTMDLILLINNIKERSPNRDAKFSFSALGYSMGGAVVAMAQVTRPGLFDSIHLFEPIILPKPPAPTPLAALSAARRADFPSREAVREQFLKKPTSIYRKWDSRALEGYIAHGFREISAPGGGVTLKCSPAIESHTFQTSDMNGTWELLDQFSAPYTVLMKGDASQHLPRLIFEKIRLRVKHDEYVLIDGGDHFVPMTHPQETAKQVAQVRQLTAPFFYFPSSFQYLRSAGYRFWNEPRPFEPPQSSSTTHAFMKQSRLHTSSFF
jgi:pimeloyl-ACP methyl ester carboxylesterase